MDTLDLHFVVNWTKLDTERMEADWLFMHPVQGTDIYIILDGIEGCMRIYCMHHDDIHRAGTAR